MNRANGYTRLQLLTALKRSGPMTADALGRELGISPVAARQHLSSLESEGKVQAVAERRSLGRPAHLYSLTEVGDETFPRAYDVLATALLNELRMLQGEEAVAALFRARCQRTHALYALRVAGKGLEDRLHELARMRSDEGYMAAVEQNGALRLVERNCVICRVAREHPSACDAELEMFRQLLADVATVDRDEHAVDGGLSCAYRVTPHSSE